VALVASVVLARAVGRYSVAVEDHAVAFVAFGQRLPVLSLSWPLSTTFVRNDALVIALRGPRLPGTARFDGGRGTATQGSTPSVVPGAAPAVVTARAGVGGLPLIRYPLQNQQQLAGC